MHRLRQRLIEEGLISRIIDEAVLTLAIFNMGHFGRRIIRMRRICQKSRHGKGREHQIDPLSLHILSSVSHRCCLHAGAHDSSRFQFCSVFAVFLNLFMRNGVSNAVIAIQPSVYDHGTARKPMSQNKIIGTSLATRTPILMMLE